MRRVVTLILLTFGLAVLGNSQETKSAKPAGGPDKAMLQAVWDAWTTLDPSKPAKYYAKGPGAFYDVFPLKYESWEEYQAGVPKVFALFQSMKATINDDAKIHRHGNLAWSTATVHHQDVMKDGSKGEGDFRWTAIWEKRGANWVIVHDHTSAPMNVSPPESK